MEFALGPFETTCAGFLQNFIEEMREEIAGKESVSQCGFELIVSLWKTVCKFVSLYQIYIQLCLVHNFMFSILVFKLDYDQ